MKPLASKQEAQRIAKAMGLPAGPLSFTQINTWLMCHRAYWHSYINHTPWDGWAENLVLGSSMHAGLEFVNRQKMNGLEPNLAGARHTMDTSLWHELSKWNITDAERAKLTKQLGMLGELLDLWVHNHLPGYHPTGVEETRYVLLGGVPVVVKIDLLDNGRKVSDFKLTKTFKNEKAVREALQLSIYSTATDILLTSFISLRFPRLDMKKPWKPEIEEVVARKKPGDLIWAEEVVASVSKGILLGDFSLCDPGEWKCSKEYCDVWSKCRGRAFETATTPKWMKRMLKSRDL